MKPAYLIVLAVGLINVAAAGLIMEKHLNRDFKMCGPELFSALYRICGTHGFDPAAKYTPSQMHSLHIMCCEKKCKVADVVTTFCQNARYWDYRNWPKSVDVLPSTTQKTTTKAPMQLSAPKMPTTTEKLASIWFITG